MTHNLQQQAQRRTDLSGGTKYCCFYHLVVCLDCVYAWEVGALCGSLFSKSAKLRDSLICKLRPHRPTFIVFNHFSGRPEDWMRRGADVGIF